MKLLKKFVIYFGVILFVLSAGYLFLKLFAFNEDSKKTTDISRELVDKLYSYLPTTNDYSIASMYTANYMTKGNINYSIMGVMAIKYINNYSKNDKEILEKEEISKLGVNNKPLYKIKTDKFLERIKIIFGKDANFTQNDFKIDRLSEARFIGDYLYVYETKNPKEEEYVIYKDLISYTVADNGNTIKIIDTYLKCSKKTNLCYNDEKDNEKNNFVRYSSNLNIADYKDKLKQYEHTFKYEDNNYYWASSQAV